jgi:lysophospholipase
MSTQNKQPVFHLGYHVAVIPEGFPKQLPSGWISEWTNILIGQQKIFVVIHRRQSLSEVRRALVVIHGFGEHGGRYFHFPTELQNEVDAIVIPDLQGHGRSEGVRGHIDHFDQLNDTITSVLDLTRQRFGSEMTLDLLGHSLGGHLVLRQILKFHTSLELTHVRSLVISAPFLDFEIKVPWTKKLAAMTLSKVWGHLGIAAPFDANVLTHDAAVVKAHGQDRLIQSQMTPRFFTELNEAMKVTRESVSPVMEQAVGQGVQQDKTARYFGADQLPVLVIIPESDSLVSHEASLSFFQAVMKRTEFLGIGTCLRLVTFKQMRHEPFNEIDRELAFKEVRSWLCR